MDFEKRLERAALRGEHIRNVKGREEAEKAMTEEEWKTLHSQCRLQLSEHIEKCMHKLSDYFPGFRYQTIVSDEGWGAQISRDDIDVGDNRQAVTYFSRFKMVIRPYSEAHIIELAAKGTIRNKEILNRTHFQLLSEADVDSFAELIDLWVLEYAEQYSART